MRYEAITSISNRERGPLHVKQIQGTPLINLTITNKSDIEIWIPKWTNTQVRKKSYNFKKDNLVGTKIRCSFLHAAITKAINNKNSHWNLPDGKIIKPQSMAINKK